MRRAALPARRPDAGFTLIEVLLVVTIIGIVATIAIPGQYDWENWQAGNGGAATHPETGVLLGWTVRTTDARLLAAIQSVWGSPLVNTFGSGHTFTIR